MGRGLPAVDDVTDPVASAGGSTSGAGESFLSLEGVSRIYGEEVQVRALDNVSTEIRAGEFLSIVGPSGSGKSTMLGLLGILDLPTHGVIRVRGVDVSRLSDAERSRLRGEAIGFVFQQFHLIPHLTALGNVETAESLVGVDGAVVTIDVVVEQSLDAVVVPIAAVLSDGGQEIVRVVTPEGVIERRAIETGMLDGAYVEVVTGVAPGEYVILEIDRS